MDKGVFAPSLADAGQDPDGQAPDKILVRDLVLACRIGVHEHEKTAPQRVRINLEVDVRRRSEPLRDEIGQVLSYEHILNAIKALADGEHINLVESLAERIAAICLVSPLAACARVRVEKLEIEPAAAGVGVEIERWR